MNRLSVTLAMTAMLSAVTVSAETLQQRQDWAHALAQDYAKSLSLTMQEAMMTGGPKAAIAVCGEQAAAMSGRLSREHGAKVTRIGTRVRNPLLGIPDAYEQSVLGQFLQRAERGVALPGMQHAEIVEEPNGRYFRFLFAIVVEERCLACHGSAEQRPAIVQAVLKESYPMDTAIDYQSGELRGAISIKQPISTRF